MNVYRYTIAYIMKNHLTSILLGLSLTDLLDKRSECLKVTALMLFYDPVL